MDDERETSQLRERRMKSPMHLSCCFHRHHSRLDSSNPPSPYSSDSEKSSPSFRSPSSWFRSKGTDQPLPGRRRQHFMARLGRRPRRHSADFSYDPLSYALNFDEGSSVDEPVNDQHFVSRLPVSPPRVRSARPRFKDLELPSPPPSGRKKNVDSLNAAAAASGRGKVKSVGGRGKSFESPMAVNGRKSSQSPAHGRRGLESPTKARGVKSMESPTGAHGKKSWVHGRKSSQSPTEARGTRKVQSPTVEPAKKSTDSPKAAKDGKMSMERRNAVHVVGAILGAMYA